MKIVIIGGTGLIGSKVVVHLGRHGHDAVAASRRRGVDTLTGVGLADALRGADAVVDVSNPPSYDGDAALDFFRTTTANLLAAEAEAGVGHHVVLSVVGTDRLQQSGYFRGKRAQEDLAAAGPVPSSAVHATQVFEFAPTLADTASHGGVVRLSPILFQPLAADDLAASLGRIATGPPVDGRVEVGGPQQCRLDELVRRALALRHDPRPVVTDPRLRYWGMDVEERTLLPGRDATLATTRFDDWLDRVAA